MTPPVQLDKTALRAQLLTARNGVSRSQAARAAQAVAERAGSFLDVLLASIGGSPESTPVALYASLPVELDCAPLLNILRERGFPPLLPVAREKATPLIFRLWRPEDPLISARYGLREPSPSAPEFIPKILFAPLLGFDANGGRLGFGGGYYDATLAKLRREGRVLAGGLCYSCQQAENIPLEKHDEKLDFVITEEALFRFDTEK
ncbi:5-formyltetrahydrofolate cyclo-ligase [uncultured Rhodoblastus sp.]|uniref:5-formyltetrahydrofolate cyclo-ligase n=1 Tax=uncultured Rhodoblastus sp. TaxID=543037 RepID=UPI0025CF2EF0|nr:5-formyltetrahydrofolate cyclo-ligase [uncultured Rhodoblastus sp.]